MYAQPNRTSAYARGFIKLVELYKQGKFQSYISSTPDMSSPITSPNILFSDLTEFPREIFTRLVITDLAFKNKQELKITSDLINEILDHQQDNGLFTFWKEPRFPADVDDTAFGLTILAETGAIELNVVNKVIDKMLDDVDENGVIRVFFPPYGHRAYLDPAVCVNALYLFALTGREPDAVKSEKYVFDYLCSGDYLNITVNYPSPDIFLYFLARLMNKSPYYRERFEQPVRQALIPRMGATHMPIELAARIVTAESVGVSSDTEKQKLIRLQYSDGGWPANTFFNFHRRNGFFGCEAMTTAFAVKALETPGLYQQAMAYYDYDALYEGVAYEVPLWEEQSFEGGVGQ